MRYFRGDGDDVPAALCGIFHCVRRAALLHAVIHRKQVRGMVDHPAVARMEAGRMILLTYINDPVTACQQKLVPLPFRWLPKRIMPSKGQHRDQADGRIIIFEP